MTALTSPIDGARGATLRLTTDAGGASLGPVRRKGDDWVPIYEAAGLLELSVGRLRALCGKDLKAKGLARKRRIPGERNEVWCIHITYDRRLLREPPRHEPGGAGQEPDLTPEQRLCTATEDRRREATLRAKAVAIFRAWREEPGVHSVRDFPSLRLRIREQTGLMPSRRTMYSWHERCPGATGDPSRDATIHAAALLDHRAGRSGGGKGCSVAHPDAWSAFEALYLDPRQRSIAFCHRRVCALSRERGWAWPSERRVAQLVKDRITPSRACLAREGMHAWQRKFEAPMQQRPDAWAPMERWDADHARLDFFVRVARGGREGGHFVAARPWVSVWLDWRTRTVCGYQLTLEPNAESVKGALLDGIRRMGSTAPTIAWLDNGKDYQSAAMHGLTRSQRRALRDRASRLGGSYGWSREQAVGILARLGIEPHFAQPYNHNGKARIERFFRTMHEDFDASVASYCGGNPGMVSEEHRDDLLKRPEDLPTLEEIAPRFAAWVESYNATARKGMDDLRDAKTGELLAPLVFLNRFPHHTRTVHDADAIALLEQRFTRQLAVGKQGIGVSIAGRKVYYGSREPALEEFKNSDRRVVVTYDRDDTTMVRVYDEQMRFVCVAQENEQFGGTVSEDARRRAHAARKQQRADARIKPKRREVLMSDAELALAKQREIEVERMQAEIRRQRPDADSPPPAIRLVRTGLEGQRDAVEREEMRKAAGAELMHNDRLDEIHSIFKDEDTAPPRHADIDLASYHDPSLLGSEEDTDNTTPGYMSLGELLR